MRRAVGAMLAGCVVCLAAPRPAAAQDEPPRIGPLVFDVRGSLPAFPGDSALAQSRGLLVEELPGRFLGLDAAVHVYLFKLGPATVGVGAQVTAMRASASPAPSSGLRAVRSRLLTFAPQLSFNFGTGNGWSYLSGGVGSTRWSIAREGQADAAADEEQLRTFNYGGGARWFPTAHVAFTFDVRLHDVAAGSIYPGGLPGTPRTRLLVMGAGISLK